MIVCTGCGNANEARAEFCGSCGTYLEWHGERIVTAAPPPAPVILPEPERPGIVKRVRYVVGLDETPYAPPFGFVPGPPGGTPPGFPTGLAPEPPVYKVPVGLGSSTPVGPNSGSASVVAPPLDLAPRAPEPEYERPAAQRPDPVDLGPADLYCGTCGAGNVDSRSYCRRCGASLADAVRPGRLPWWRRMFTRRRRENGFAAGQRPKEWSKLTFEPQAPPPRRVFRFPRRIVLSRFALPLIALSVLGMGLGPMRAKATEVIFDVYHSAQRKLAPEYVHVTPKSATASDAVKNRPASAAIDRNTTTYWSEGRAGLGSVLTVTFDRPVSLAKIGFDNGASGKDFPFQPRLRDVEVTYFNGDKTVGKRKLTLADKPEFQTFTSVAPRADRATIKIVSVYAGQKGSAASLAEVAFVTLR